MEGDNDNRMVEIIDMCKKYSVIAQRRYVDCQDDIPANIWFYFFAISQKIISWFNLYSVDSARKLEGEDLEMFEDVKKRASQCSRGLLLACDVNIPEQAILSIINTLCDNVYNRLPEDVRMMKDELFNEAVEAAV